MNIRHLNCISTCPLGGALMDGHSRSLRGRLSCHCLLVEAGDCLVLVDTGMGLRDVADPRGRLSGFFLMLLAPDFRNELTAVEQIKALGYDPRDVRHIVLTHLDFDHAGGLDDFPQATVHMLQVEREIAVAQRSLLDRMRYRPQQWSTQEQWKTYSAESGEHWYGFDCVRGLDGLPPEILLVPLPGHTFGHAAVAIEKTGGQWLLQAGDAYFYHAEMDVDRPRCTPGLRFYQWMMQQDGRMRVANQKRLRKLKRDHGRAVQIMSSHDVSEFERAAHRALGEPPTRASLTGSLA
ncbi:MAG TPA: MBL fold metallo-hydrolase [Steroidobacteraceae bacterium]|nr:MBL fold metallo-hydrolase [Steroidobacteraceae bacterium]